MNNKNTPHLLDEQPIMVYPTLAVVMGLNKAVVFQKLHFLLNGQKEAKNNYNFVDGRWWVYNSYPEWQRDYFPWLSVSALKGIFNELEDEHLVLARQSVKSKADRRKWYTIDYEVWDKKCLTIGQNLSHTPSAKNYLMVGQKMADESSNSSSNKNTKEKSKKEKLGLQDAPNGAPTNGASAKTSSRSKKKATANKVSRPKKEKKTPPPPPPRPAPRKRKTDLEKWLERAEKVLPMAHALLLKFEAAYDPTMFKTLAEYATIAVLEKYVPEAEELTRIGCQPENVEEIYTWLKPKYNSKGWVIGLKTISQKYQDWRAHKAKQTAPPAPPEIRPMGEKPQPAGISREQAAANLAALREMRKAQPA